MANRFNEYFPSFIPLHLEFSPGLRVIDDFSDCISFNVCDKGKNNKSHTYQLDDMVLKSSSSPPTAIIISDVSIKNNVTTFISHMYINNKPLTKMIHHMVYITSTKAELFAIRYSINQATNFNNMSKIIVVTDFIHVARKIFKLSVHPYQVQSAAILFDFCNFFKCHKNNFIEFWKCPSHLKWHLHKEVNKETKTFNLTLLYLCKMSWDFNKKSESDDILKVWKMTFQASDLKENQFLNLLNNNNNIIELSYIKEGSWLKTFSHSNHALISKYRLRFFPRKKFKCSCGLYPIESRHHILHECGRFNGYWNPRRDSLGHFIMFLETNPSAFTFSDSLV